MPIIEDGDCALTLPEAGRIRAGARSERGGPARLATFRLTSPSRALLEAAAARYGGTVRPWTPPRGKGGGPGQWELYTEAGELPLLLPPVAGVFDQWYELWSGSGCLRRCDGRTAAVPGEGGARETVPCRCPADRKERARLAARGEACRPVTRLRAVIEGIPTAHLWRFETRSAVARRELASVARAFIAPLHEVGRPVRARLRLDHREGVRDGARVSFPVPVLDVDPRDLAGLAPPPLLPAGGRDGASGGGTPPGEEPRAAGDAAAVRAVLEELAAHARGLGALAARGYGPQTALAAAARVLGAPSLAAWLAGGGDPARARRVLDGLASAVSGGLTLGQAVRERLAHERAGRRAG